MIVRWLVVAASFQLFTVGRSAADDPAPADIAARMAAREQATGPYALDYRVRLEWDGKVDWNGAYEGAFATDGVNSLRRLRTFTGVGLSLPDRNAPRERFGVQETLVARRPAFDLYLYRMLDPKATAWKGVLERRWTGNRNFSPEDFGLRFLEQPVSSFVAQPTARVAGREEVDGRRCVVVLAELGSDPATPPLGPVAFWLAEEIGYFPVQWALYSPGAGPVAEGSKTLEIDGRSYVSRFVSVVAEVAPAGAGWIATKARQILASRAGSGPGLVTMEADAGSLRTGAMVTASDVDLPVDIKRASVRNRIGGGSEVIGHGPFGAGGEFDRLAATVHGSAAPPPAGAHVAWIALALVLAAAVSGLMVVRRRPRAQREL